MTHSVSALSARQAAMPVLIVLSVTHLLNDMIQSLIPAIYPIIKDSYALDFAQIGLHTRLHGCRSPG
jgi:FSR family fosmidomycin resistance protein-like MFS transporter